jgi:hypothetical protein
MEQKINIKKFPCMHGNINFVWSKMKVKEKFPHVFHKQLYLHGIFPSIDRKKHRSKGEGKENKRVCAASHKPFLYRRRPPQQNRDMRKGDIVQD